MWFEYPIQVYPHHTDYAGIVWHGSYLQWMEEARVACLASEGLEFHDLVELGCDLPVVDVQIRYRKALTLGMQVCLKLRMPRMEGVRWSWEYELRDRDDVLYLTAKVELVAIDRETKKVLRRYPPPLAQALTDLRAKYGERLG